MAFTLIDGVLAHDEFAAPPDPSTTQLIEGFAPFQSPTPAGTSALVEGMPGQEFSTPASSSPQPVDGIQGLTTWEAPAVAGEHTTSGTLVGQTGGLAASSTHIGNHSSAGALTGQLGGLAASASHSASHASTGALVGQAGGLSALSLRLPAAASLFTSGALIGEGASLSGIATRSSPAILPSRRLGGSPPRKVLSSPPRDEFAESLWSRYQKPPASIPLAEVPPSSTLTPLSKVIGQTRSSVLAKFPHSSTIDLTKLIVPVEESIPDEVFLLALL